MSKDQRAIAVSLLIVAAIFVLADCLMRPTPNPTPSPATRLPVTVLPTVYIFVTSSPVPTVTPREMLLVTRVPTATRTPMPTATPVPPTPARAPVQKG